MGGVDFLLGLYIGEDWGCGLHTAGLGVQAGPGLQAGPLQCGELGAVGQVQAPGTICGWCQRGRCVAGAVEGRCRLLVGGSREQAVGRAVPAACNFCFTVCMLQPAHSCVKVSISGLCCPNLVLDDVVQEQPSTVHSIAFPLQSVFFAHSRPGPSSTESLLCSASYTAFTPSPCAAPAVLLDHCVLEQRLRRSYRPSQVRWTVYSCTVFFPNSNASLRLRPSIIAALQSSWTSVSGSTTWPASAPTSSRWT